MVTIKDISKKCGYSSATVSKALNGGADINQKTVEHILNVAKGMGYFPNAVARALKTNRTYNLGVLFVDKTFSGLAHEYFSSVLNSFKVEAERLGYDITFISRNINRVGMSYLDHCHYRGCDGVVIASIDFSDPDVVELVQSNIPIVTIDHVFNECTSILSDNVQSVKDLVTHVYNKGHRKIAFIHGEDTSVTRKRLGSFHRTCSNLGIDVQSEYLRAAIYHDPKSSGLATRELLALKNRPSCILYPDDFSILGGITEIERAGLSIPEDISIVGYDGIHLSQVLRPRLTTLRQDTEILGREAAAQLVDAIENPKSYIPQQIVVPGTVIEGETVKQL